MVNSLPRFLCRQAGRFIPLKLLLQLTTPAFLPFYHVVSDDELPHILNYNYRNVDQFEKELDFYLRHFNPVSLEELVKPDLAIKKPFHISFDDGLRECAEIVAPILLKKGIPTTFFVNPAFIDNKALFHKYKASLIFRETQKTDNFSVKALLEKYNLSEKKIMDANIHQSEVIDKAAKMLEIDIHEFLKQQQPYLTTSQLKDLQEQGFTIGAHSNNHAEFWQITEEEQREEITGSMNWVNKQLVPKIKTFAFPFTDSGVARSVMESLQNENKCDISFGTAGIKFDELDFHFQRYPIENSTDFISDLKSEMVYFQLRKIVGKATVKH